PSTRSIATACERQDLIDLLAVAPDDAPLKTSVASLRHAATSVDRTLETSVSGLGYASDDQLQEWVSRAPGHWWDPEYWTVETLRDDVGVTGQNVEQQAKRGAAAAADLRKVLLGQDPPLRFRPYLAIIMQDLDDLGASLSRRRSHGPEGHQAISEGISLFARQLRGEVATRELLATPVYVGGDDALLLAPAKTAIAVARVARAAVSAAQTADGHLNMLTRVTASTAVLFFHSSSPLSSALSRARELLSAAKGQPGKDRLAVGVHRRSGAVATINVSWGERAAAVEALSVLVTATREGAYSGRLIADLDRAGRSLRELHRSHPPSFDAEIRRLVGRHTRDDATAETIAASIASLGKDPAARDDPLRALLGALRVARALNQEDSS
ncbi:Cas10/Cmr2 second palm domain-containing protein, partial [Microbacterium sp.]|uniref:Cas10/Cmr2 second palm domain-containing protein n=1 Tax=Microbacterium sp. TaxID=51671 RepID=UPI003A839511